MTSPSPKRNSVETPVIKTHYILIIDAVVSAVALALAVLLRYESLAVMGQVLRASWALLPLAGLLRLAASWRPRLYAYIWRYASLAEVFRVLEAVSVGTLLLVLANWVLLPQLGQPPIPSRAVFIIDWALTIMFVAGSRMAIRVGLNWLISHKKRNVLESIIPQRKVLIAGAGDMGAVVTRLITNNPEMGYDLVGYVDDDPLKLGKDLHGFRVLGGRRDIVQLAQEHKIDEVIIAISTAPERDIEAFQDICASNRIPTRVIPNAYDLLSGTLSMEQIRQWRSVDGYHPALNGNGVTGARQRPVYHSLLITGGAGFIGSNFVRYMLETYPTYRIVVYDLLTYAGNPDNLLNLKADFPDRYIFIKGDIAEYDQVALAMKRYGIDCIVNFAAESHVDRSLMEPHAFLRTNVTGAYTLLEAARNFRVQRFHQISTDEVYGEVIRGSFSEQDPLETRSPYSASKAAADLLVHAYNQSFGVPTTITRGSNTIGPYQYPEKAVPLFVTNAIDNQPLPVYGDGLYVRDYQHVRDHCRGIDLVLHEGAPGEIYNLGGGAKNERTALELARIILDRLGKPHALIHLVQDRPGQDRRYSLNCAKIRALGWKPQFTFDQTLDATIAWYVENEWWWRKIKDGEYRHYYEKQFSERLEKAVQSVLTQKSAMKE
ncbi:MAG: dTDP-glucose 4,6-dehydratase [Caldilineales bacterium]|nr:dTDP-glucose 4,6-dehydratase [Caldilineales bacterium]